MRLFSRFGNNKKKEPKEPVEVKLYEAIIKYREAIETLEKRRLHIEKKVCAQTQEAQNKAASGDKNGALFALKRRKAYQQELDQVSNAHMTLERQIINLESAQSTSVAVGALQTGVQAQQQLNQQNDLNKMDKLMDELTEQQELQNEFNQVFSQGNNVGVDDDTLLAELDTIQGMQLDDKLASMGAVPSGAIASQPNQASLASSQPTASFGVGSGVFGAPSFSATVPTSGSSMTSGFRGVSVPKSDEEQLRLLQAELG